MAHLLVSVSLQDTRMQHYARNPLFPVPPRQLERDKYVVEFAPLVQNSVLCFRRAGQSLSVSKSMYPMYANAEEMATARGWTTPGVSVPLSNA